MDFGQTKIIFHKIINIFVAIFAIGCFSQATLAAPITRAEAKVLSFGAGTSSQNSVIAMTSDSKTTTTGWTNATYDAAKGMVIEAEPGTYSFGFGSYVPENYSGPGAMYLHRVLIKDQAGVVLLDESFNGWSLVSDSVATSGNITRSRYSTTGGIFWNTYADTNSFFTGYGEAFASVDSIGDKGMVYPMDGGGPFSVLIKTLLTAPAGTTHLNINVEWRYDVDIFSGQNRTFTIGVQKGDVPTENLFSFSAPATPATPAPTVTAVTPATGSTAGGTPITITGTDLTGATAITVGGAACISFNAASATSATCTTPPGAAGTASVVVTTAGGNNAANTLFTYEVPVAAPIPTLSEWAMIFLASLMAMFGIRRMRRNK